MMSACRYGPFSENLFGFLQLLDGVICVSMGGTENVVQTLSRVLYQGDMVTDRATLGYSRESDQK